MEPLGSTGARGQGHIEASMNASSIAATLRDRGQTYGPFSERARVTQALKRAMADSKNWDRLSDDQRECLENIAQKIGRILNGDPNYVDSWHDIIGYTRLVEERLTSEQFPLSP